MSKHSANFNGGTFSGNFVQGKVTGGASQFCKSIKILLVIANEAKRNEAIAKYSYCDCFAPFHSARNDKIYFYTFGMLPSQEI